MTDRKFTDDDVEGRWLLWGLLSAETEEELRRAGFGLLLHGLMQGMEIGKRSERACWKIYAADLERALGVEEGAGAPPPSPAARRRAHRRPRVLRGHSQMAGAAREGAGDA